MFINFNKFHLGKLQKNKQQNEKATAVILKKKKFKRWRWCFCWWSSHSFCKDNPILFDCQFRNLLEEKCNKDINY